MKVTIENFQSIGKAVLTFTGLSVIVGPSNHGKSAVLRAIEGALFNRPGEHVVRKGAKNAQVCLVDLPALPYVLWTKGAANKYQIDGVDYSRVGQGAPQPLQDAGYRDVWIGDAAAKKGEAIRPQVGEQFDPLFLLTRSSGFVADVLGLMSRHHIVATAQDRCASDLRSAKQRLGVRRGDLDVLDAKLAVLAVYPHITPEQRAALQDYISTAVTTLDALRRYRETRIRLRSVPAVPAPATYAAVLRTDLVSLRELLTRKWSLQRIPATPLRSVDATAALLGAARVIAGVRRRRVLAGIPAPSFKPLPVVLTRKVQDLRPLVASRKAALDTLYEAQQSARACEGELVGVKAKLDTLLASTKVCPTCGQSMSTVGV